MDTGTKADEIALALEEAIVGKSGPAAVDPAAGDPAAEHEGDAAMAVVGTQRSVLADGPAKFRRGNQHHLAVYGRDGRPCNRCGTPIRRLVQGARSSFYCPRCQR